VEAALQGFRVTASTIAAVGGGPRRQAMADSSAVCSIGSLPILDLAKVGFFGLACLIFVLAAIVLSTSAIRGKPDTGNNFRTFLGFGIAAIVIAGLAQFSNPHSSYKVTMSFSPDMAVNGLPFPRVMMNAKQIKLDEPFSLDRDDTIQVGVDEVIKAAKELRAEAEAEASKAQTAQKELSHAVAAVALAQDALAGQTHESTITQLKH
jgi:hypothetical protein